LEKRKKVIPEMYEKGVRADVVVVDPPRKGCDEAVLKTLVDMKPERIVYVSIPTRYLLSSADLTGVTFVLL